MCSSVSTLYIFSKACNKSLAHSHSPLSLLATQFFLLSLPCTLPTSFQNRFLSPLNIWFIFLPNCLVVLFSFPSFYLIYESLTHSFLLHKISNTLFPILPTHTSTSPLSSLMQFISSFFLPTLAQLRTYHTVNHCLLHSLPHMLHINDFISFCFLSVMLFCQPQLLILPSLLTHSLPFIYSLTSTKPWSEIPRPSLL